MRSGVLALVGITAGCLLAGDEPKHKSWPERRPEFKRRLAKLESDAHVTPEQRFLHDRISNLLKESRSLPAHSYVLSRTCAAIDSFLDASEQLRRARSPARDDDDDDDDDKDASHERRHTARALEKTYFRVKQADYFSAQSKYSDGPGLVQLTRRIYQQARSAYDDGAFGKARRLAEASREVVSGLERLAQAAAPIPSPPRLH